VQSVDRAFEVLETLAALGGIATLSRIAARAEVPAPTIHRLLRTLVRLGYVRQEPTREYALGPGLIHLGESSARLLGAWARPHLSRLVEQTGESANLAMLEGDQVVYVAHVSGLHSMRMFTEAGSRAWVHCTAVGKAMAANLPDLEVERMMALSGMPASTRNTITDASAFAVELRRVRERGWAIDDEEQEIGVRCVATAVPGRATRVAMSLSGPSPRMTDSALEHAVPLLAEAAQAMSADLALPSDRRPRLA
jgi:IclR family acetate operon transcriptional repressor